MNFFPTMFDFKIPNLYNMTYPLPYGFQYPYLDNNQMSLNQIQFNPSFWNGNNGLF